MVVQVGLSPGAKRAAKPESASPLARLWSYAARHRAEVRLAAAYSFLNKVFDILPEVLIGFAVDAVVNRQQSFLARAGIEDVTQQLFALGGLTLFIWVCESGFEFLYQLRWRNLAQSVQHELRLDAYRHVQTLDVSYFEDRSSGGLMSILNDDVNQLERFLDGGANSLIQVASTVLLVGGIFFALAPSVAWMAMLPIPVILLGAFRFQDRIAPHYAAVRARAGALGGRLAGNLSGIATIKSFTAEAAEAEKVEADSEAYVQANAAAIRLSSAFIPLIRMAIMAGFIATLVYGGILTLRGELAVGSYSILVFLTQRLLWPLTGLAQTVDQYQRAMASTQRILDLLGTPVEIANRDGSRALDARAPLAAESIDLEHVSFSYAETTPTLNGVTIRFEGGKTTAIVGSTGSGKSTIVKLLLRFYDPKRGRVRIGGVDLREFHLQDLRRCIGLVSQDVFLFHGSVRDNIAYGKPGADAAAIEAAARKAEAHEFILALPQGYDTLVGERGQKLSGGQRQRLSLARAILKNPPILILDEATSAVDNETEAAIQRSLERVTVGRTTIAIAHRLSTIRKADRIYVLEDGKVVDEGTHAELSARNGIYAGLWRLQTGN